MSDKLSVRVRTAREREGLEARGDNKKWALNHVDQPTGSRPCPREMTVHFGMRVWCPVFWPAHSDTMVRESWPHFRNLIMTSSGHTERQT